MNGRKRAASGVEGLGQAGVFADVLEAAGWRRIFLRAILAYSAARRNTSREPWASQRRPVDATATSEIVAACAVVPAEDVLAHTRVRDLETRVSFDPACPINGAIFR